MKWGRGGGLDLYFYECVLPASQQVIAQVSYRACQPNRHQYIPTQQLASILGLPPPIHLNFKKQNLKAFPDLEIFLVLATKSSGQPVNNLKKAVCGSLRKKPSDERFKNTHEPPAKNVV